MVLGTEMHWVTFIFVLLEIIMLICQLLIYYLRPQDGHRRWYLILLLLLIIYNITGGLFPDPAFHIPINAQNIIAYGSGFMVASYFPFYFYKAFDLTLLRFHALYGVPLFLLLPYIIFFVITYLFTADLDLSVRYGMISPFFYSLVLLRVIFRAIRIAYRENRNQNYYFEEIMVYCAVAPWSAMTVTAYFGFSQLTEVLFTNLGFLFITCIFIFQTVRRVRREGAHYADLELTIIDPPAIEVNCKRFGLSARESDVIMLICQQLRYREIAEKLFISERTVNKHVQNIFNKVNVTTRSELIQRMNNI